MKEVAAVMIILAFAGAKATPEWGTEAPLFEEPRASMEVRSSNGTLVGTIKCKQQTRAYDNTATDISGHLPGLPPGDYLSVVHKSESYNGSCDSAGPFVKQMHTDGHLVTWFPFPMITVVDGSHDIQSFPGAISFDLSSTLYLPGRLVLFYSLPRNSPIWFDGPSARNALPPAAACGILVDDTVYAVESG